VPLQFRFSYDAGGSQMQYLFFKANGNLKIWLWYYNYFDKQTLPENVFWVFERTIGIQTNTIAKI
jgi:hypothetical protein